MSYRSRLVAGFIHFGFGSCHCAVTDGYWIPSNFARWCRKLGIKIKKGRKPRPQQLPIEGQITNCACRRNIVTSTLVCVFGWILDVNGPLPALLVVLFTHQLQRMSIAFGVSSTSLLVDFYPKVSCHSYTAASLVRCGLGARFHFPVCTNDQRHGQRLDLAL